LQAINVGGLKWGEINLIYWECGKDMGWIGWKVDAIVIKAAIYAIILIGKFKNEIIFFKNLKLVKLVL
jgi:hypothetical protein